MNNFPFLEQKGVLLFLIHCTCARLEHSHSWPHFLSLAPHPRKQMIKILVKRPTDLHNPDPLLSDMSNLYPGVHNIWRSSRATAGQTPSQPRPCVHCVPARLASRSVWRVLLRQPSGLLPSRAARHWCMWKPPHRAVIWWPYKVYLASGSFLSARGL